MSSISPAHFGWVVHIAHKIGFPNANGKVRLKGIEGAVAGGFLRLGERATAEANYCLCTTRWHSHSIRIETQGMMIQ
ncbi:MAG: hypothetical protein ACE5EM_11510 [Sphingomonadales bacterium]